MGTPSFGFSRAQGGATGFSPAQGGSAAAWTPESLTGLVDEWDAAATYCTTDAGIDFVRASNTRLQKDSPTFGVTNKMTVRWTMTCDDTTGIKYIITRFDGDGTNYQFWIRQDGTGLRVTIPASAGDTTTGNLWVTQFSAAGTYECVVVYDGTESTAADRIKFYRDGALQTVNTTTGTPPASMISSSAPLCLGDRTIGSSGFDGMVQAIGVAADALTGSALTAAHSSGLYADRGADKASYFSFWNLTEASGARADSVGSNDLTAYNTPSVRAGVASGTVQDRAPVKTWTGKVNGLAIAQATIANQPLWTASGQNSQPVLTFDGVNDYMTRTYGATYTQPNTIYIAAGGLASGEVYFDGIASGNRNMIWSTGGNDTVYGGTASVANGVTSGAFKIYAGVFNGASSLLRANGVDGTAGSAGTHSVTGITVAASFTPGAYCGATIGSLIVQNALASADEKSSVDTYLNDKYAAF